MGLKGEIHNSSPDVNPPLCVIDRTSRQKTKKETADLNNTIDQMDLKQTSTEHSSKKAEYTFFSSTEYSSE